MTTRPLTRTLVMMRHGHAAGFAPGGDRGRHLTPMGRAEAHRMGGLLAGRGFRPDLALVSDAERTRQTWAELQDAGVRAAEEQMARELYNADATDIVDVLRQVPDHVGAVLVVAHFPGIPDAILDLAGGRGDEEAWGLMRFGYPTAGVATLAVDADWADVDAGGTRLTGFDAP